MKADVKTIAKTMKIKVCYTGFNLYNQISFSEKLVIDFTDFEYEFFDNIVFSHTFTVLNKGSKIYVHGSTFKDISLKNKENVNKIECVDNIIFILCDNGNLYKIDLVSNNKSVISSFINTEHPDDSLDYITDIACGLKITIAVTTNNKIYNIPNRLEYHGEKIKQIVVGREHCLLLNVNGGIYSFGCGIRGQLGHGILGNEINPRLIEALAGVKIIKIAAGGWHSCALSITGDLYTWGWNSNGQLALSKKINASVFATPQPVSFPNDPDCVVNDIACGTKHTIVFIGSLLYGSGWNKYNQMGKEADEDIFEFKLLKDFSSEHTKYLQCGPWCTAIIKK